MNLREELAREREAYTADPADCERCRFAPGGRCRVHEEPEQLTSPGQDTILTRSRESGNAVEAYLGKR